MEFGSSMAVESVQELASNNYEDIPRRYIRPEAVLEEVSVDESSEIPVIDMSKLASLNHENLDFQLEMKKLHQACQDWGFFQVINHGSEEKIEEMKVETAKFFKLPLEEKMAYAMSPTGIEGYGQHFVVSNDQKLDWCDILYLSVLPYIIRDMTFWPNTPITFRSTLEEYSFEVKRVFISLLHLMAINLGVNSDSLNMMCEDGLQLMRMNYYPPCAQANNVLGITPHSDGTVLTLLVQANEIEGLQIKKCNKWVPVKPLPGAMIVNIGDVMEILSNGMYKSIEHRAVVNLKKERLSIAAFHGVNITSTIGPLVNNNEPNYKTIEYKDFVKMYFQSKLDGKNLLNRIKIERN